MLANICFVMSSVFIAIALGMVIYRLPIKIVGLAIANSGTFLLRGIVEVTSTHSSIDWILHFIGNLLIIVVLLYTTCVNRCAARNLCLRW